MQTPLAPVKKINNTTGLDRFNRVKPVTDVILILVFLAFSLMCVIPAIFVVSISFSAESSIREFGYRLLPRVWSVEGYAYLFKQGPVILRSLGMSLLVTISGTALGVLLTALMGYVLSRPDYKLKGFFTLLVFIPMVFNGGLVSTYVVNTQLLMFTDKAYALILPLCVSSFNIVICRTFFRLTIPDSLIESAKIDGARQLLIFFRIVLPLSLPVLATIALFLCFGYWNDWFQAMLYITDPKLLPLQAFVNKLMGDIAMLAQNAQTMGVTQAQLLASMPKEAARMAVVVVVVVPIACAYPFFQKYFISGLTVGAVKG